MKYSERKKGKESLLIKWKSVFLKRDREDEDKDEDPLAGSNQRLKKQKTSKDAEPPKGFKSFQCKQRTSVQLDVVHRDAYNITSKQLPLIEVQGCQVVPADYFFNNDLEITEGGSSSKKYKTSTTKTKDAKYDNIEGIKDMVLTLWSPVKVAYDKYAMWGITHWGPKRQSFYGYTRNRKSTHDVFSKRIIIVVTHVKVMKWYNYRYLEEVIVQKDDQKLYKFIEGDFPRLNLRDIENLLLLLVQKKLSNLEKDVIFDLNVALRMFTRCVVILKRVEDLQLGVKSYQNKLNLTKPKTFISDISKMTPYIAYKNPQCNDKKRSKCDNKGRVPTEMELILEQTQQEHQSDTFVLIMKMEILPVSTSNNTAVVDLCDSIRIKLVTSGKQQWYSRWWKQLVKDESDS
ncbi:hypothetical protein Tco_1250961 [Tanacetum coccineum]